MGAAKRPDAEGYAYRVSVEVDGAKLHVDVPDFDLEPIVLLRHLESSDAFESPKSAWQEAWPLTRLRFSEASEDSRFADDSS